MKEEVKEEVKDEVEKEVEVKVNVEELSLSRPATISCGSAKALLLSFLQSFLRSFLQSCNPAILQFP
ncbi:MAG TPA: hypothetical protein VM818_24915 [Vicinamibacterales bacterium]|nr:hypothetical protein [Vicinamibacterales bacterium]